jgi:hypothetical protein
MNQEKRDPNQALRRLWEVNVDIVKKRGIDLPAVVVAGAESVRVALMEPGARTDFDQLCERGCFAPVLALLVWFMRFSPNIRELWSEMMGKRERRQRAIRTFQKAADTIDDIFADLVKAENEITSQFTTAGFASPAKVTESLRFYCRVLDFSKEVASRAKIRSSEEMAKFLLTSYVSKATGKPCDRNVSGIVAEILGPTDHNEVAQRMWRHRNSKRLKENLTWITDLLHAGGVVVANHNVTKLQEN